MVSKVKTYLGDYFTSSREKGRAGLPLLSVTLNNGIIQRNELERKTETNITPEEHLFVKEGDIAYNMMRAWQGALGRAYTNGIVSPAYIVLRPNKDVDSSYAEYLFNTKKMIYLFWAYSYGITNDRLRLYFNDFKRIPAIFPCIGEQKKIARILSLWDKAIKIAERLLINSHQHKKYLLQQLLTKKIRTPRFRSEFKRYHFSDLLKIDAKSLGKNTPENFEFNYISLSDVDNGRISSELECHKFQSAPSRARRIIAEDDILLSTVRPNLQGFAKIQKEHAGHIASTGFAVLTRKENVCADYVYHYLFSAHITGQINSLVVGTNYPAINSSDVSGLSIYCPEYEEQKEIAEILSSCDSMIYQLQHKIACLKKEKRALMQQLLTGKRRVIIDRPEPA
ncbi:restriction endonuclease subunit S [Pseudomonas sp. FSL R10-1350]|uniref:restriction endonuclease subunit S n=1 Tax=Pseudomonas sp. FSL R10-1350 TaxID=2662197 RepID=UPI001297A4C6|nr:restriction endonuclease subunit S [Pseudomonas sp. FSL R10-1350]MQU65677.1 restriction endonuclease subunit S [Pseudomonas sp. FSL R10-1350]